MRLGIPVRLWFQGARQPVMVALLDLSASGGGFHSRDTSPPLGTRAAFGFVMSDKCVCLARGRVVRRTNQTFALVLDKTNTAFRGFLGDISGPVRMAPAA